MARILPGSLGSTFSGVEKTRRLSTPIKRAMAPDTPHGFDALAETLQHPLTGMAVGAASRIRDEIKYKNAVDAEKERVDKAKFEREQAMEQAQNVSRYRQQLEQQAQDPNIQDAIRRSQDFEANRPGPVDFGYAGFQQTGMTSSGVPIGKTMGATGMPTGPGYDRYTHEDLLRMGEQQAELDAMRQQEAAAMQAIGPEVQERFIPRTVAEFQAAIANEPDPQRRQQLLVESTRAVDVQPGGVEDAIRGSAGQKIQRGVRGADVKARKTEFDQAEAAMKLARKQAEFEFDQKYKSAKHNLNVFAEQSKASKRDSEIKLNQAKLNKFNRRMAAASRRRGAPDWFKTLVKEQYGGDFAKAASDKEFSSKMLDAAPNMRSFNKMSKIVTNQLRQSGLQDGSVDLALKSEINIAQQTEAAALKSLQKAQELQGVAESELQALKPVAQSVMKGGGFFSDPPELTGDWARSAEFLKNKGIKDIKGLRKMAAEVASKRDAAAKRLQNAQEVYQQAKERGDAVRSKVTKRAGTPTTDEVELIGVEFDPAPE